MRRIAIDLSIYEVSDRVYILPYIEKSFRNLFFIILRVIDCIEFIDESGHQID